MRALAALLLVILSACATGAGGGAPPLPGSYRLAQINGRALPAESPTEPGVMLERGTLELASDGRYTLQVHARAASQPTPTAPVVRGTYRVEGDALALTPDDAASAAAVRFQYLRDGRTLRLRDDRGNEFVLDRS